MLFTPPPELRGTQLCHFRAGDLHHGSALRTLKDHFGGTELERLRENQREGVPAPAAATPILPESTCTRSDLFRDGCVALCRDAPRGNLAFSSGTFSTASWPGTAASACLERWWQCARPDVTRSPIEALEVLLCLTTSPWSRPPDEILKTRVPSSCSTTPQSGAPTDPDFYHHRFFNENCETRNFEKKKYKHVEHFFVTIAKSMKRFFLNFSKTYRCAPSWAMRNSTLRCFRLARSVSSCHDTFSTRPSLIYINKKGASKTMSHSCL